MKTILLTGFEAFGSTPVNPAEQVAMILNGEVVDDYTIVSVVVPNTFFKAIECVKQAIAEYQPVVVIMMGEYGGRSMLTVERLAQNLNDSARYSLADNDGKVLQGEFTEENGPAAYYSNLPVRAMVKAVRDQGIPADISDTPGTNVCNHLMYGVLHFIHVEQLAIRAGWIHLPHLPSIAALSENLGAPSMSKETSAQGVKAAIGAVVMHDDDINESLDSRWQL
jgi:pyroglutamyl-peptidase|tara:strand:+ start:1438 stop:2106 length:669 start_codon:yes stop_codon:yes gene_type:complete